ncbi:hypothetical protein PQR02_39005 [Paraburkholderia sediminicola]|uniref:Uncharacterized protein n=1 Tax=Paraburkholderia rhynchosiae TaxID=487049 RepID=A0ACC7NPV2_9BURK
MLPIETERTEALDADGVRQHAAEAVSKRALHSSAVETGLRERPTTASVSVGNGKATLQNLAIFRFDTASAICRHSFARLVGHSGVGSSPDSGL